MKISEILEIKKGVTAIVGGGGKTSLMLRLAEELEEEKVIICTTTKIFPLEGIPVVTNEEELRKAQETTNVVCVTSGQDDKGKLNPPDIEMSRLTELSDYVICEADGAKRLPLKAHAEYEPVIPEESNQVILLMGIDGIGKRINEACHRPEIYSLLAGVKQDEIVTPKVAMEVINKEKIGTKILINKVEDEKQMELAEEMSGLTGIKVIAGSIRNGEYRCL